MLTAEENELLTRTNADRPMGQYFRRFWQPAALSDELREADGAPVRVTIMGEELIAFRDTEGRIGLVDAYCAHRGANLFFGRNEQCGLRCVYHGWKFDVNGKAVDLPNVPAGAALHDTARIKADRTRENLCATDAAIVRFRRTVMEGAQALDPATLDRAWDARAIKLGRPASTPRRDGWWSFRVVSRQG